MTGGFLHCSVYEAVHAVEHTATQDDIRFVLPNQK